MRNAEACVRMYVYVQGGMQVRRRGRPNEVQAKGVEMRLCARCKDTCESNEQWTKSNELDWMGRCGEMWMYGRDGTEADVELMDRDACSMLPEYQGI